MASLSPPFILCPLPDRKALLGIRPDCLQNKAIVTLGKNIAIRYHVLEQKQESSWTTSRYWFTSPVIYCYDFGKYGAVLNHNIVALWDEEDATLANITKTKLQENVFGLHSNPNGRTIVIMKNGSAAYLSDLTEDKSSIQNVVLGQNESLVGFEANEKHSLCYLITKSKNKKLSVVGTRMKKGNHPATRCVFGKDTDDVLGFCLVFDGTNDFVVYFSSDGSVYKQKLQDEQGKSETIKLANLSKQVSKRNPVIMCPLPDCSSIAIYGSDPSEEGAIVVIYDVHYDLVVSKQSLKLYSIPPLMEKIDQSLFVPLGLHILVLNFKITKSLLSSVVGKHQAKSDEEVFEGRNPWITQGWDPDNQIVNEPTSSPSSAAKAKTDKKDIKAIKKAYPTIWQTIQQVQNLENEGQPEAIICNHVVPSALEQRNGEALEWILNTFMDIPEVHVVSMIVFFLQEVSEPNEPFENHERLNNLLQRKVDKYLLSSSLRHVDYDVIKKLMFYIAALIQNQWQLYENEDEYPMNCWLNWCSAIVDAHYTKFVLHSETNIIEHLLNTVCECSKVMEAVAEMEPFLSLTYSKTSFKPSATSFSRWRTETVTFE